MFGSIEPLLVLAWPVMYWDLFWRRWVVNWLIFNNLVCLEYICLGRKRLLFLLTIAWLVICRSWTSLTRYQNCFLEWQVQLIKKVKVIIYFQSCEGLINYFSSMKELENHLLAVLPNEFTLFSGLMWNGPRDNAAICTWTCNVDREVSQVHGLVAIKLGSNVVVLFHAS